MNDDDGTLTIRQLTQEEALSTLEVMRAAHESIYHESNIPKRTRETLDSYVEHGVPPGHFVEAVLANDFIGAFGRADLENTAAMPAIAAYVRNRLPMECHGSYDRVEEWVEHCGLENRPRRRAKPKKLRAIVAKVDCRAVAVEIDHTLEAMQGVVGGYLEAVLLEGDAQRGAVLYCNDDGARLELPYNRTVNGHRIAGDILVVGAADGDEVALTEAQIARWLPVLNGEER